MKEQVQAFRQLINGYKISSIIMTANEIGLFHAIDTTPQNIHDISEELNLPKEKLSPILNALVYYNLIEKDDDLYYFKGEGSLLNPKSDFSQLGYVEYAKNVMKQWATLTNSIENPKLAEVNFENITGGDKGITSSFLKAMNTNALPQVNYIVSNFDFSNRKILDIGAGSGIYGITIFEKNDNTAVTLFDLPGVAKIINETLIGKSLDNVITVESGNYHESIPDEKYDDIFLFAVIHQESVTATEMLIKNAYNKLNKGGRLFITSFFLDANGTTPEFPVLFAVEMLVMVPNSHVYKHIEIQDILKNVGFEDINRDNQIPGPGTLYVATK